MEIYGRVRRAVLVEGRSQRAVAQEFGLARKAVQKMLRYHELLSRASRFRARQDPALAIIKKNCPTAQPIGAKTFGTSRILLGLYVCTGRPPLLDTANPKQD